MNTPSQIEILNNLLPLLKKEKTILKEKQKQKKKKKKKK